jgi:hypothetical protein
MPLRDTYATGYTPSISLNDNGDLVELHKVPGEDLVHYIRGRLSGNTDAGFRQVADNAAPARVKCGQGSSPHLHCERTRTSRCAIPVGDRSSMKWRSSPGSGIRPQRRYYAICPNSRLLCYMTAFEACASTSPALREGRRGLR